MSLISIKKGSSIHMPHGLSKPFTQTRSSRGNMIVLIAAVTAAVVITLVFYCLKMTRIMGGYAEQRTAIEAAALAAAKDLSNIVVSDPNVGWIGLSDSAPVGSHTAAPDGYDLPVTGINTLLATVRLDMYIADSLDDPIMQQRAADDYKNAVLARKNLVAQLNAAATGGSIQDINGQSVNPLADASAAYKSNVIRMTGSSRNYLVPNSMKLTLGCIPNSANTVNSISNTPIPLPAGVASVKASQQSGGYYAAFEDIPYISKGPVGTAHFVFAGSSNSIRLVDPIAFSTTAPGLADPSLLIPSVVDCQADQQFIDHEQGKSINRIVHIAAAAECSCAFSTGAHPGALTFSFPNGVPPEITSPLFLYSDPQHVLNWSPVDMFESPPVTGDYPESPMAQNVSLPYWNGPHPRVTKPISLAIYDWIRQSGATVNVQNLIGWLNNAAFTATDKSVIYAFEFTPSTFQGLPTSVVTTTATACPLILSRRVSSNQWVAIAGGAMKSSNGSFYDLIIKDDVYNRGSTSGGAGNPYNGGIHGGQPLSNQLPPAANPAGGGTGGVPSPLLSLDEPAPGPNLEYPYANGSGIRPTYNTMGQAVDIRFRFSGYPWPNTPCGPPPWPTTPTPLPDG